MHIPSALTWLGASHWEDKSDNDLQGMSPHLFLNSGAFFSLTLRLTRTCESGKFKGKTGETGSVQDKKGFTSFLWLKRFNEGKACLAVGSFARKPGLCVKYSQLLHVATAHSSSR